MHLVTNFSWKRLFHVLIVIGLLYGGLRVYDGFTGTFTLGRLQRSTELLAKLHAMEQSNGAVSPELDAVHHGIQPRLMSELGVAVGKPTASGVLRFWLKFLAASLPWSLIAFFAVRDTHRKGKNLQNMLIGIMSIVFVFAAIGGIIPTVGWPWFNLIVYPFLPFLNPETQQNRIKKRSARPSRATMNSAPLLLCAIPLASWLTLISLLCVG